MPWDKLETDGVVQEKYKTIRQSLDALPYYQDLVTRGIPGGQSQRQAAERTVNAAIADIKAQTNQRRQMIQEKADETQQTDLPALTRQIQDLAPEVEQQKTIYQLRTEQASVLVNKYASNWSSSWWGLWFPFGGSKPLTSTTRTLVYVAAVALVGTSVWASFASKGRVATPTVQEGGRRKKRGSV
jgi:hypothetical protein